MSGQLESTLVLALRDTIKWASALEASSSGTLTPVDPAVAFDPKTYQQRDRELAFRDLIVASAAIDTSVEISNIYNYPALKPRLEGPSVPDLSFAQSEITVNGTASGIRHVKNASIPWDASRYSDSDLYGRDALTYEILARACQAAFINPPISRIDAAGTIFPDFTAWSLGEGQAQRADINPALPLNRDLFKLPDQNLADRDTAVATYVATLAQVLKNPFAHAMRLYVRVTGPGTAEREPEIYVLTSDDGIKRIWQAEPALSNRNRITYSVANKTLQWVRESSDEIHVPQIYAMSIPGIDAGEIIDTLPEIPEQKDAQFWRLKASLVVPAGEQLTDTAAFLNTTYNDAAAGGITQIDSASLTVPDSIAFTMNGTLPAGDYRVSILTVPCPRVDIAGAQNTSNTSGTLGGATFDVGVASGDIDTKQYIVVNGEGIVYNSIIYAVGDVFTGLTGVTSYTQLVGTNPSSIRQYAINFTLALPPGAWKATVDYTDLSGNSTGFGIKAVYTATGAQVVDVLQDAVPQPVNSVAGVLVTTPISGFDVSTAGLFNFPVYWTYGDGQLHVRKISFVSETSVGHYVMDGAFTNAYTGTVARVNVIGTAYLPDVLRFDLTTSGAISSINFKTDWTTEAIMPIKLKQVQIQRISKYTPTPLSDSFAGWRQECLDRAERVIQQAYDLTVQEYGTNVPEFRSSGSTWNTIATENWMSFLEVNQPRLREITNIATNAIATGRQYEVVVGPVNYGTNAYSTGERFYGETFSGTNYSGGNVKQVGALTKALPGHCGKPALVPLGLAYASAGTVTAQYSTDYSEPIFAACVPWMIDQGIYVAKEEFWMPDYLVTPSTRGQKIIAAAPAPPVLTIISLPGDEQTAVLPSVNTNVLTGMATTDSITFYVCAKNGAVYSTTDGYHYVNIGSDASGYISSMAYGNGLFVLATHNNAILTSTNAVSWTSITAPTTDSMTKIIYANGKFVAVGANATVFVSSDGANWFNYDCGTSNDMRNIAYGGGVFIAVGNNGSIARSTDGIVWTQPTSGNNNTLYGIMHDGTQFIIIGDNNTQTSPDGTTWTPVTTDLGSPFLRYIAYSYGNYVLTLLNYSEVDLSTNITHWTQQSIPDLPNEIFLMKDATFIALGYSNQS